MKDEARAKFCVDAGLLIQGSVRASLQELKNDILWEDPKAEVIIEEFKIGLLTTRFMFRVNNTTNVVVLAIQRSLKDKGVLAEVE